MDDGSKDSTTKTGLEWSQKLGSDKLRVLTLAKNLGKGGAVRRGMLVGRGKYLLFADADGATTFSELAKLQKYIFFSRIDLLKCGPENLKKSSPKKNS